MSEMGGRVSQISGAHRVSECVSLHLMLQKRTPQWTHVYDELKPQTAHRCRAGSRGGGAAHVRYVGMAGERLAMFCKARRW